VTIMTRKLIQLDTIGSTNVYLSEHASMFQEDMVVVVADYQTSGKGQGHHSWESESGKNLLFSILIHPHHVPIHHQFLLSMAGALSIKRVLDEYVDDISLKWPNDIYWRDSKLCGTLIENTVDSQGIKNSIFGIGLNVNQARFLSDAPNPISLFQILKHEMNREKLLDRLIDSFARQLDLLSIDPQKYVVKPYHEALYRKGEAHLYQDSNGIFMAILEGVNEQGQLLLRDEQGHLRTYSFKEVAFIHTKKKNY